MKTFDEWREERNLDLPTFTETPDGETATSEGSTKRAGVRGWAYPSLYSRGQYTKAGLRPTAADAVTYDSGEEE